MAKTSVRNVGVQTANVFSTLEDVKKYMKFQLNTEEPDKESIDKCMAVSFDYRRHFILSQDPKIKDIYDEYPALFEISQVIEEFRRIEYPEVYEVFLKNLKSSRYPIIKFSAQSEIKKLMEEKRRLCNDPEVIEYIDTAGSLLLLPSLLEESLSEIITFSIKAPPGDCPIIRCAAPLKDCLNRDTKFEIFAEKLVLCETVDLRCAFFALCACYYIFNMSYTGGCMETMAVVERELLQIPPEMEDPPKRVREVAKLLNQFKKLESKKSKVS